MTEIQAAVGRQQLRKLPKWHDIRNRNAAYLNSRLGKVAAIRLINPPEYVQHAYYKYDLFLRPDWLKKDWNRNRVMVAINDRGVPCFAGSCSEIYLEKAFEVNDIRPEERLPNARELGETSLTFWVHPLLDEMDMAEICDVVECVLHEATRQSKSMIVIDNHSHTEISPNLYHSHT